MSTPSIILYTDSDVFAGTERHIFDLALGLREQGADAAIACPRPGALAERALAADMRVIAIPKRGIIDRHAVRMLADQLRRGFADVIHAHNGRTHIVAAAAVKEAGRGACVMTQHFLAPARTTRTGPKAWISSYLHRRASMYTSHVIAISDAVREAALARGDVTPEKVTTIHNGIAPIELPDMPDTFAIRSSVGVNAYAPLVFCAARLQAEKDVPTLIAAIQELRDSNIITPTPQCVIAGTGDLRAQLDRQVADAKLNNFVQLLGFRDDIPALLRACDVFALPSLAEPFGLVLVEAMALAKPVIATDTGGPREIVQHETTGLLVPPRNPKALAAAIAELLANQEKRRAMGQAGYRRYMDCFTANRMAREVLDLYERVLSIQPAKVAT